MSDPLRLDLEAAGYVVGEHHVTYAYRSEASAGKAYRRVMRRGGDSVSCWRYVSKTGRWYVTAIAEREAAVRKAERLMRIVGAARLDEPPEEGMLDSLRERRWQTCLLPAIRAGGRGVRQRIHFAAGAELDSDGGMHPHRRPQG